MVYGTVYESKMNTETCVCVSAAQQSIGRGSQVDKQSSDSSPDANDEQWLSQVCLLSASLFMSGNYFPHM